MRNGIIKVMSSVTPIWVTKATIRPYSGRASIQGVLEELARLQNVGRQGGGGTQLWSCSTDAASTNSDPEVTSRARAGDLVAFRAAAVKDASQSQDLRAHWMVVASLGVTSQGEAQEVEPWRLGFRPL